MMKKRKVIFSFLFALIMVFQLGAPIAGAAPAEDIDHALSVYYGFELTPEQQNRLMDKTDAKENEVVSPEMSLSDFLAKLPELAGFGVKLGEKDLLAVAEDEKDKVTLKDFAEGKDDIVITAPEGYYVSSLQIQSDNYKPAKPEDKPEGLLPAVTADPSSANITLSPAQLRDSEGKLIINVGEKDPGAYCMSIVFKLINGTAEEHEAEIKDESGADFILTEGKLPELPENTDFWKLTYVKNGTAVLLAPGTEIHPYDDCTISAVKDEEEKAPEAPGNNETHEIVKISVAVNKLDPLKVGSPLPDEFCTVVNVGPGLEISGDFGYELFKDGTSFGTAANEAGDYEVRITSDNVTVFRDGKELAIDTDYVIEAQPGTVTYAAPAAPPTTEPEEPTTPPTTEPEEPTTPPTTEPEEPTTPPTTEPEEPTTPPTTEPETPELVSITVKPKDIEAEYNGSEHKAKSDVCTITVGHLRKGDSIRHMDVTGSQTNVGTSYSEINENTFAIKNKGGKDVTKEYDIKFESGKITVTPHAVTFKAIGQGSGIKVQVKDENKTVSASELKLNDGSYEDGYEVEGLLSGHSVNKITVNGSGKAGTSFTTSIDKDSIVIADKHGTDVTANYDIDCKDGRVTVTTAEKPSEKDIPLTITAKDAKWTYDGEEHECHEYSASGLKDGDQIKSVRFKSSSSIKDAGSVKNEVESIVIVDKNGNTIPNG